MGIVAQIGESVGVETKGFSVSVLRTKFNVSVSVLNFPDSKREGGQW
jgi:hypothetical protein